MDGSRPRSRTRMSSVHVGSLSRLVRPTPPPRGLGIAVAALLIVVETLLVYPLRQVMPPYSGGLVYILGVLVASLVWGMWLGLATAVVSTLAFVFFHVRPLETFAVSDIQQVVELAVLLIIAVPMSAVTDLYRLRAAQAQESGLTAEMTRLLLNADDPRPVLPAVAGCIARFLELPDAAIHLAAVPGDDRHAAFPLCSGTAQLGTLLVPVGLSKRTTRRLRKCVVPSLASLLHAGRQRAAALDSLESSREQLRRLAAEQAALGRVAKLVAHGSPPSDVFQAIVTELHGLLGEYSTWLCRYEPDGTASVVSANPTGPDAGRLRWPIEGENVLAKVRDTGRAARVDSFEDAAGPVAAFARELGIRSVVGVPIVVDGRLWGVAGVAWARPEPLPADTEARVADFTDLAATAIANTDSKAELAASRARLVAAADQARQRIERDLHDGAMQHFLAVAMQLGAVQAALPAQMRQAKAQLARALCGLNGAMDNLREISRGIHPTLLASGGLPAALKALARRSPVPVELDLDTSGRMPPVVETAAYYVVSEALTNAAKHGHATVVQVRVAFRDDVLRLSIQDDGIGGADPHRGTGLTGLRDRVEALGGHLTITSPTDGGTRLLASIPTTSVPCVAPD
ncbi:sensor histidine kinase [Dactylosporangium sp. CA-052675]|uniref:sensor histidine kinase n=1 Tax=Dactylosporangium sp. CA-052675 TaxID=3239927 RepID=UPI003D8EACC0